MEDYKQITKASKYFDIFRCSKVFARLIAPIWFYSYLWCYVSVEQITLFFIIYIFIYLDLFNEYYFLDSPKIPTTS